MRRSDLELLRVVSAFGVVWYHAGDLPGREAGYAGLVVFLAFSAYLAVSSPREHKLADRVSRLLVPCLIWSVVYGGVRAARGVSAIPEGRDWLSTVLVTTAIHLWYLPFIFFVIVGIDLVKRKVAKRWLGYFGALVAVGMIAASPWWREHWLGDPWDQYLHALPGVGFGLLLGCFGAFGKAQRWGLILAVVAAVGYSLSERVEGFSLAYAIGIGASCLLLLPRSITPASKWALTLGATTFGVYLVHILALLVLTKLGLVGVPLALGAFVLSTVGVLITQALVPKRVMKYIY